jgi:hypothetical protein
VIVDTNVGTKRAAEDNLFAFERDGYSYQLPAQKNERRPKVARLSFGSLHNARGWMDGQGGRSHHQIE